MQVTGTTRALGGFDAAPTAGKAASGGRSFAAALKAETTVPKTAPRTAPGPGTTADAPAAPSATPAPAPAATPTAAVKAPVKLPKGERHEDVPGHKGYDEIIAGPRNGMFINTSGNARDGLAFTLVERGGFSYHVYGTGRDRQVFRVGKPEDDGSPSSPRAGTTPAQKKPAPATGASAAA